MTSFPLCFPSLQILGSAQSPQVYPCMHCTLSSSEYEDLPLSLSVHVVCVSHDLQLETILRPLELQPRAIHDL